MSKRIQLSEAIKKRVAGKQSFKCANSPDSNLKYLEDYFCELWLSRDGSFNQALYEIDHIEEYCLNQNNEESNLQALCPSCHRVKTNKFIVKTLENKEELIICFNLAEQIIEILETNVEQKEDVIKNMCYNTIKLSKNILSNQTNYMNSNDNLDISDYEIHELKKYILSLQQQKSDLEKKSNKIEKELEKKMIKFEYDENAVEKFFETKCTKTDNEIDYITSKKLFKYFMNYTRSNNMKINIKEKDFKERVMKELPYKERYQPRINGKKLNLSSVFTNIKINREDEINPLDN